MDITIKVTGIHVVVGIFASLISAALTLGWFGFKNDIFAFFIAVISLYITGQACQKMFGDDISGVSQWLGDGIVPFYFIWVIAYTLFTVYL